MVLCIHKHMNVSFHFDCGGNSGNVGGDDGSSIMGIYLILFLHKKFTRKQIPIQNFEMRFGKHDIFQHNSTIYQISDKQRVY